MQTLLSISGQGGIFCEPCKSHDMPRMVTEWCRQGGRRLKCSQDTLIWLVQAVPGAVTVEQN